MATRTILWQFTLQPHNDGAGRRVSARSEPSFQRYGELLTADQLACPWRDPDAFGPRGSSAHTLPGVA